MADSPVASLTDGTAIADTDRFYVARSPYGAGDDRYVDGADIAAKAPVQSVSGRTGVISTANLVSDLDASFLTPAEGNAAYQPLDADLTAFAALVSAADKLPYFTGSATMSLADFSAFARTLLDDANQAAMQTTLGLVPGSTVQAFDSDLTALAVSTGTGLYVRTGSGASATRTITATGLATITDGDGVAAAPVISVDAVQVVLHAQVFA